MLRHFHPEGSQPPDPDPPPHHRLHPVGITQVERRAVRETVESAEPGKST
jgi:actin-like ATPase involved in cell morphogenesis